MPEEESLLFCPWLTDASPEIKALEGLLTSLGD